MNEEIKKAWLEALRSGEYKQGRNYLHIVSRNEFCCLGVLCDLAVKAGVTKITESRVDYADGDSYTISVFGKDGIAGLPESVKKWADLDDGFPNITGWDGESYGLDTLNDGDPEREIRPHTFEEIADLIEKNL